MSWQEDSVLIVRSLINDVDYDNYTYSDERIEEAFITCAYQIVREISFNTVYVVTLNPRSVSPDPVLDYDFMNLTCLKTACLFIFSEYKTAAASSLRVTDGPSTVDYTNVSKELKNMYDSYKDQYDRAKFHFNVGEGSSGKVILTPYSPGSDFYNYRRDACR